MNRSTALRSSLVAATVFCFLLFLCSADSRSIAVTDEAAPIPPLPVIAPSFFDPNASLGNGVFQGFNSIWYDGTQQLFRQDTGYAVLGYYVNFSMIQSADAEFSIQNGVCRKDDGPFFQDLFGWLQYSTYNGQVFVDGRGPCDEWVYRSSEGILVLDSIGNTPVQLIIPEADPLSEGPSNNTFVFSTSWTPTNFTSNNISIFSAPASCNEMKVCPSGPAVNQTIYLFHDPNDYTLIDTNVADEIGDVFFVCLAVVYDAFGYFSWISEYNIEVNTTFGQYSMCNFGTCLGGANDRVGQEAPDGIVENGGQCDSNNNTGNWYSLPVYNESLCPGGGLGDSTYNETVGINGTAWSGCGWRVLEKVKTINGKCLESHGFRNACIENFTLPLTKASQIWQAAFMYDDESQGGCPPIINATLSSEEWLSQEMAESKRLKSFVNSRMMSAIP